MTAPDSLPLPRPAGRTRPGGKGARGGALALIALAAVGSAGAALAVLFAAMAIWGDGGASGGGAQALRAVLDRPAVLAAAVLAGGMVAMLAAIATLALRRAERRARQSEARLSALEAAGAARGLGAIVADAEGRVRYATGLAPFMVEARAGALAARVIAEVIEPADEALPATIVGMAARAAKGEIVSREFSAVGRGGDLPREGAARVTGVRYLQLTVGPFAGGVTYLMEDVSGRRAESESAMERVSLLSRALDRAPFGILVIDEDAAVREANSAFRRLLGGERATGKPFAEVIAEADRTAVAAMIERVGKTGEAAGPIDVRLAGDAERTVALYASQAALPKESGRGLVVHVVDATERKRLEAQFAQSQKMQAVGQLAGGIAHDFNNMLTAIIGFCDLMLQRHPVGEPSFADAMQIKQNANRAAGLVRQLLAFSRQQTLAPRVIDMTDVLAELSNLLRRLLGERVELTVVHGRDLWPVKADPGQIEQVVINLAVNARDAMGDGGRLTIQTGNFSADRAYTIGDETMSPGDYIAITVSDTGMGMTKETIARVFEPFFTTKEVGTGTGLGLAMVYGSIRQLGGFVHAHSDGPGKGASFTLYLPRSAEAVQAPADLTETEGTPADTTGGGKVLLVEDEDAVRLFAARALRAKGYDVTEARTGESALEILADRPRVDLLVTDMVMPKVDGATLIREARKAMPDLPVICISGYTQESVAQEVEALPQVYFLPKPFSLKQLATKVKAAIESAAAERA